MDGDLHVEVLSNGKHRWCYVSVGGATHYSPTHYKSASSAKAAGARWLEQYSRQRK